ncbi:hypothetical protein D0Z08_11810 [Nocardioides immobilis]|uniref:Uncharacterized protein n=1 Tax=Nocardioides immobilis TaxID=2049295 RepID=A0A417Y2V5_9ACTN|nr:hypothetical protein [Nocardioides immobilis]RHW26874.1 hypothetical protein D0Z08_11810 [Nocardioides immobilis]
MNDLNQLLHDAAGSGDDHRLDPRDLLTAGKRKVRNRRLALAGGAVAAVVAAAALVTGLPSDDDRQDVVDDPDQRSSSYEEVRIPVDEVERRCSVVLNGEGESTRWVGGVDEDGTAVSAATTGQRIENREGHIAELLPAGTKGVSYFPPPRRREGWSGSALPDADEIGGLCLIPQADLLDGVENAQAAPLPPADDHAAVADLCAHRAAYDVGGWQVVATAETTDYLFAMLRSDNGYYAACMLEADGGALLDLEGLRHPAEPRTAPDRRYPPYVGECADQANGDGVCVVYGADLADGFRVDLVGGERVLATSIPTNGAYLVAAEISNSAEVAIRITSPDGDVLEEVYLASHGAL